MINCNFCFSVCSVSEHGLAVYVTCCINFCNIGTHTVIGNDCSALGVNVDGFKADTCGIGATSDGKKNLVSFDFQLLTVLFTKNGIDSLFFFHPDQTCGTLFRERQGQSTIRRPRIAGIFVGVTGRDSAEAVAYFLLSVTPAWAAVGVLFVAACFVSMAMGTSVGTITLITPIAVAVSHVSGFSLPLCIGSVMGGAMFGDNLSFISQKTGVSVENLQKWNDMGTSETIYPGQKLKLEGAAKKTTTVTPNKPANKAEKKSTSKGKNSRIHVVQKGESLWDISKKYGVSVEQIKKLNGLTDKSVLKIGQKIIIRN